MWLWQLNACGSRFCFFPPFHRFLSRFSPKTGRFVTDEGGGGRTKQDTTHQRHAGWRLLLLDPIRPALNNLFHRTNRRQGDRSTGRAVAAAAGHFSSLAQPQKIERSRASAGSKLRPHATRHALGPSDRLKRIAGATRTIMKLHFVYGTCVVSSVARTPPMRPCLSIPTYIRA